MTAEKTREQRLRRAAKRQGLELAKSKTRDPRALDYGRWRVLDGQRGEVVAGDDARMSIDDVERYLLGEDR